MKDKSMVTIPLKEYEKLKENEERLVHILESIAEDIGRFERVRYNDKTLIVGSKKDDTLLVRYKNDM